MPHNAKTAINSFVEAHQDALTDFLAELVKVPSDNPPGDCAAHGARAAELLEGLGLEVERHPVPEGDCRANGMISATNLIVRRRFGDGPVIALNAHGDVVAPGEGWTFDPYGAAIRDGMMYGRGVAVSKSDFATYTYALLALQALEVPLAGTVELHLTYDEEAGGEIGPKWLLDKGLSKPDFAFSAGFSYSVVTAHNGCLHLEITVLGISAHAARPDTGFDALEAATAILQALYKERNSYRRIHSSVEGIESPSLVVGLIEGGINTNVVPDRVVFRLDRRMIPEEDAQVAEQRLREVIEQSSASMEGVSVQVRRIMLARPFAPLAGVERIVEPLAANAAEVFGRPIETHGIPLYTDARHYAAAGVPTVLYGAGPHNLLEANAHRADERLRLDDLKKATKVVALTLYDLLSGNA